MVSTREQVSKKLSNVILLIGFVWAIGAAAAVDGGKSSGPVLLILAFFVGWIVIVLHELGHALVGWFVGLQVLRVQVGPVEFFTSPIRIKLTSRSIDSDVAGAVHFHGSGKAQSRVNWVLVGIAGPAFSALTAVIFGIAGDALVVGSVLKPTLVFGSVMSASYAVANLMPFKGSDGSLVLFGPSQALEHPPRLP